MLIGPVYRDNSGRCSHAMRVFCTRQTWKPGYDREHSCAIWAAKASESLFALGLDNFFAAIKSVRTDVMPQMRFARSWFYCEGRISQEIVRPVHTALGRRFLVLLNCHGLLLII